MSMNKKIPYHRECFGTKCAHWLETKYYYPIVWHKDGKATACPWKNIYHSKISQLITELQAETQWYIPIIYTQQKKEQEFYSQKLSS